MSFFDDFMGNSQRDDLQAADAEASLALSRGYKNQKKFYEQAYGLYDPYAERGNAADEFYSNALGLNGTEPQTAAVNTLTSNPLFQGELGQESNALARLLNARGASGGGQAHLAAQRVFQSNAGNWLNRYRDMGQQGLQVAGQQAGIRTAQGDNAMGYGSTKAGQAINMGNAMAGSRGIGINNIFNTLGLGVKAFSAFNQK